MYLQTFAPDTEPSVLAEAVAEDGAAIIENAIDQTAVQEMIDQVMPYIESTPMGGRRFYGEKDSTDRCISCKDSEIS